MAHLAAVSRKSSLSSYHYSPVDHIPRAELGVTQRVKDLKKHSGEKIPRPTAKALENPLMYLARPVLNLVLYPWWDHTYLLYSLFKVILVYFLGNALPCSDYLFPVDVLLVCFCWVVLILWVNLGHTQAPRLMNLYELVKKNGLSEGSFRKKISKAEKVDKRKIGAKPKQHAPSGNNGTGTAEKVFILWSKTDKINRNYALLNCFLISADMLSLLYVYYTFTFLSCFDSHLAYLSDFILIGTISLLTFIQFTIRVYSLSRISGDIRLPMLYF